MTIIQRIITGTALRETPMVRMRESTELFEGEHGTPPLMPVVRASGRGALLLLMDV